MKTYKYQKEEVVIVRDLDLKDKTGTWVQIEFKTGDRKKSRIPVTKEELK